MSPLSFMPIFFLNKMRETAIFGFHVIKAEDCNGANRQECTSLYAFRTVH